MGAGRERRVPWAIGLAVAGFGFQQLSMNALLPALQKTFHATTAWSTWLITAFLLVGAVTTPLTGRLSDQFGRSQVLRGGLVVFTIGCLGAAFAPSLGVLIAFRALSGISGAFVALGVALIGERLPPARIAGAVAALAASLAAGNLVAALLAPVIASALSWRWVFLFDALIPLTALALLRGTDVASAPTRADSRIDGPGAVLLATAIGSVMLALTEGNHWGWGSAPIVALLMLAVIAGAAFVWVELHVAEPMIQLGALMRRTVLLTNVTTALAGAGVFASLVLVSRFVAAPSSAGYGFAASTAVVGLFLAAQMSVAFAAGLSLGPISRRYSWKLPLVVALIGLVVGLVMVGRWHAHPWQVVLAMMVIGLAAPTSTVGAKLVADDVDAADHGVTAGLNMVAYYIGGVLGTQGVAAILDGRQIPGTTIPTAAAYTTSFYVLAAIALIGVPLALMVHPRGREPARSPIPIMENA
jgi:MFS family permease